MDKVSKKKQKALAFRKSKEERDAEKDKKAAEKAENAETIEKEKEERKEKKAKKEAEAKLKKPKREPINEEPTKPVSAEKELRQKQRNREKKEKKKLMKKREQARAAGTLSDDETEARALDDDQARLLQVENLGKREHESNDEAEEPKKKRTRRGKGGKEKSSPRFILFVGNLPYDIKELELSEHFKAALPDRVRPRREKGIAFLEFDHDTEDVQKKMERALRLHHSTLRKRKINVELTVGGGGNSETRKTKLKEKNTKLDDQRKAKSKKDGKEVADTLKMHPSRAALLDSA